MPLLRPGELATVIDKATVPAAIAHASGVLAKIGNVANSDQSDMNGTPIGVEEKVSGAGCNDGTPCDGSNRQLPCVAELAPALRTCLARQQMYGGRGVQPCHMGALRQ